MVWDFLVRSVSVGETHPQKTRIETILSERHRELASTRCARGSTGLRPFRLRIFFNVYLFWREGGREREIQREPGRGREREGDTECEAGSRLRAVSTEPGAGLELTDLEIMT